LKDQELGKILSKSLESLFETFDAVLVIDTLKTPWAKQKTDLRNVINCFAGLVRSLGISAIEDELQALRTACGVRDLKIEEFDRVIKELENAKEALSSRNVILERKLSSVVKEASNDKARLFNKVEEAEIRTANSERELDKFKMIVTRERPMISVIEKHSQGEAPIPGCLCAACKLLSVILSKNDDIATWRKKQRETYDELKSFRGPPSKKKKR